MTAALCAGLLACNGGKTETTGSETDTGGGSSGPGTTTLTSGPSTTSTTGTTDEPTSGTSGTTAEPGTSTTTTTTEPGSTGGSTGETGGGMPMPVACAGKIYQCGDAIDNDGDGKIDGGDKECTSPCDDSEGSFQTDLPGQNLDCKNDCYWDDNSGAGNDKCEYDLQCDPQNPGGMIGCAFKMECEPKVPQQCLTVCEELVPNGCDCFGCCHIATDNGTVDIFLGSNPDCSLDNLDACGKCTFQESCNNNCEPENCEVCFGEELPPGCEEASCEGDDVPCEVDKNGVSNCAEGFFCQTGCCKAIEPG